VLRRAARETRTLFIGIDANAAAMAEASRRAARPVRRGGSSNALFVAAPAECLPSELRGRVDVVTVALPWGSLLLGLVQGDERLLAAIATTLRPGGELTLLVSAVAEDRLGIVLDDETRTSMLTALEHAGFVPAECRPATRDDAQEMSGGWARRLAVPERRDGWLLRLGYAGVAGASGLEGAGGVSSGSSSL
jgi:hypothetical protein